VNPAHIEAALMRISDIKAAAAFPVPTGHEGLAMKAVVASDRRVSAGDIVAALPPHLRPHNLSVRRALPMSPAGKVLYKYLVEK
jgi:acyl-coenzyme A synthetase/AMP-(fatty) acid ligase